MSQIIDFKTRALLAGKAKVSNAGAAQPITHDQAMARMEKIRFSFDFDEGGEPLKIPASAFLGVALGTLPLESIPADVVKLVLGMWASKRLKELRESGV